MSFLFFSEAPWSIIFMCIRAEKAVASDDVSLPVRHDENFRQIPTRRQGLGIIESLIYHSKKKGKEVRG